jgi:transglutaminase-like putative cysteine protease
MTDVLPDTIRRLYTDPGEYIDSDHSLVQNFARTAVPAGASEREKASLLYKAVRDGIRYNPYANWRIPEVFRASSVLAAGNGYCVGKAALYAAACRVHGIPARVGFADVRNHLTTEKLRRSMGTDVFIWHGFSEVHVDGAWRKATPTFNATLCAKLGVHPLEFDGHNDALLHPFDGAGRAYMQYVTDHGSYHDIPAKFLMQEMTRAYANMLGEDLSGRDMEREAAEDRPVLRATDI